MTSRLKWPILAALAAFVLTAGVALAQTQVFSHIIATRLTVQNLADFRSDVVVTGDLTVTGDQTFGGEIIASDNAEIEGSLIVNEDATVGGVFTVEPGEAITVTSGGTITPTASNLLLTSDGDVGTRLIVTTTMENGAWLFIQNVGSDTITLTDTAPLIMGGNAALGANDTLILKLDDGSWIQYAKTDN